MITSIITLCFVILCETCTCSHRHLNPAFMNRYFSLKKVSFNNNKVPPNFAASGDAANDAMIDAEEVAAINAHDVSDPGMEGAAMERSVIMAADIMEQEMMKTKLEEHDVKPRPAFFRKIRSVFHHDDAEESDADFLQVNEAEAKYAHYLSDVAAMEHADEILLVDSLREEEEDDNNGDLLDATEAEANYAHDLADVAATEHANEILLETNEDQEENDDNEEDLLDANESEANYAPDLSATAAMEHVEEVSITEQEFDEEPKYARNLSATISMTEQQFDEELTMLEKSILAATDKLELYQEKAAKIEYEAKAALEEKYEAKALIESIERERRAAEMRFLSTEHYDNDDEVKERLRDSSVMHADDGLLADALKREHDAELRLESAIEDDIAAKEELERMIDSKVTLKQELRDLEGIVHERAISLWKEEEEKKEKKPKSEEGTE
mmetsp:Transcript_27258/g.49508  ORF Transcript_27258/g.49508 Transcript_27258/m.49508 type:complete len:442 (-) Transcript_27258:313-1638(-)